MIYKRLAAACLYTTILAGTYIHASSSAITAQQEALQMVVNKQECQLTEEEVATLGTLDKRKDSMNVLEMLAVAGLVGNATGYILLGALNGKYR